MGLFFWPLRGRGYQSLRYLLLKAERMAVTNVEFIAVQRLKKSCLKMAVWSNSRSEPVFLKLDLL
jgi:hypothetical protein